MGWCAIQCKMLLLCAKTINNRAHIFEVASLKKKKKKKKKKILGFGWLSGLVFLQCFAPLGMLFIMKHSKWRYIKYKLSRFWEFIIYCASVLSLHIESMNSMACSLLNGECMYRLGNTMLAMCTINRYCQQYAEDNKPPCQSYGVASMQHHWKWQPNWQEVFQRVLVSTMHTTLENTKITLVSVTS